ncbi:MAG: dienelactone hydrolase family protein [Beijerinckiaceae bacterium]|nr:dienelactone hydrolase family protein [Beijerinckiaceae bacterium]
MRRTIMDRAFALFLLLGSGSPGLPAEICGVSEPCKVESGAYYAVEPQSPRTPGQKRPAVIFFHGAGGTGREILSDKALVEPFIEAGYVALGPVGLMRPNNPYGAGWSFRPEGPQQRDELAFAKQVLDDAAQRFEVDRNRVLMTGFSIGASLVWYMACKEPGLAAAYAPIAGGFWRPLPQSCAGPIDLLHTHGWRDQTVPLEGRPLGGGVIYQGDIFDGLKIWRETDHCTKLRADDFDTSGPFWSRTWSSCETGKQMVLALHTGSHDETPAAWGPMALRWFESRLKATGKTH